MLGYDRLREIPRRSIASLLPVALLIGALLLANTPDALAQYKPRETKSAQRQASITVTSPTGSVDWEKGKRYEVTWTSSEVRGSVKIELVDQKGIAKVLTPTTLNNGKYSFSLMRAVSDGDYRVRISSTDGKTVGESSGLVHVSSSVGSKAKTPPTRTTSPPTEPIQRQGKPPTPVSRATRPTTNTGLRPGVSTVELVRREFSPVQVSDVELQHLETSLPELGVASGLDLGSLKPINADGSIDVLQPQFQAEWVAGNQVSINWSSDDITGNVKIDLLQVTSPNIETWYPVTAGTSNDGHHLFTVPHNLGCKPWAFKARVATLDEQVMDFSENFSMYTEPVDMACRVVDITQESQTEYYIVYAENECWLQFDVWLRNDGTMLPVTVQNVSVILIKEPEEIMLAQEEWGFSGIYPRIWYKTPEPRRFDISESWHAYGWKRRTSKFLRVLSVWRWRSIRATSLAKIRDCGQTTRS